MKESQPSTSISISSPSVTSSAAKRSNHLYNSSETSLSEPKLVDPKLLESQYPSDPEVSSKLGHSDSSALLSSPERTEYLNRRSLSLLRSSQKFWYRCTIFLVLSGTAIFFFNPLLFLFMTTNSTNIVKGGWRKPAVGVEKPIVMASSHNDEMQKQPFTLAHSLGIPSIECDVHLLDGILLAGHEEKDLHPEKTFKGLYLDPIYQLLLKAQAEKEPGEEWRGIYDGAPDQELYLLVDMKGDGRLVYPVLLDLLKPFIQADWLTVYEDGVLRRGPLTIVGTGDTPLEEVLDANPRYVFYDAPLMKLSEGITRANGEKLEWSPEIAPMASQKWPINFYLPSLSKIRHYSQVAHSLGIQSRWWGVARQPRLLRLSLWKLQLMGDTDWLNADDLEDVARFLREYKD